MPCATVRKEELLLLASQIQVQQVFIKEINSNADQLSSQFKLSVNTYFTIPSQVILVDCIQALGLSIKRETFTAGENVKLPFLCQFLVFFNIFF